MKKLLTFILLFFTALNSFAANKIDTYLVGKLEYKDLESSSKLIDRLIVNAFGVSNEDNDYKFNIKKVDCWNEEVAEFRYFPEVDLANRSKLSKGVLVSGKNSSVKFRVTINSEKSFLTARIREYLDENSSFEMELIVVGDDRVFVTEAVDKDVYNEILRTKTFVDKAFKNFFGVNVMNMNYHIEVLKTTACLIKDLHKLDCTEAYDMSAADSAYNAFSNKISAREYSSSFILFDVTVTKDKSRLTQKANDVIIRDADRSEHIRFYFCIPKYNLKPGSGRFFDIEGKIVTSDKKPFANVNVELRDATNKLVATQKTDKNGYLKFAKVDEGMTYTLFVDKAYKEEGLKLTTNADKTVGLFKKTKLGFDYKLLTPVINTLEVIEVKDPSDELMIKIKARIVSVSDKINPIADQVVELRDFQNKVLQTKMTNKDGDFEFSDVNIKEIYSVELFEYKEKFKNEKLYISNTKNELVARISKDANGKFAYKTIPADLIYLSDMKSEDVSLTVKRQLKLSDNNLIIRDFVYYEVRSTVISSQAKITLDKIIKIANENKESKIEIISHTDVRGEGGDNLKLSQKRSEAVLEYFVKSGIDKARLNPIGKGELEPLNSCTDGVPCTEDEYKMNRRTEFRFYK
ncbi:MAG: OmpA family protein [Sphingobacteriaceae bacterium]|nr:OmpA family protein [Sphingobacteriaceae bacterium]